MSDIDEIWTKVNENHAEGLVIMERFEDYLWKKFLRATEPGAVIHIPKLTLSGLKAEK